MASAILTHTSSFCVSSLSSSSFSTIRRRAFWSFQFSKWVPQLGLCQWNGLKNLGISTSPRLVKLERKGKCKCKGAYASLFGVGAPEALVIGVVALLVFGPKGLADIARNLGKTLRAFQPTIKELQEVSREFKSTLEREIGIDEMQNSNQNTFSSSLNKTTSSSPRLDGGSKASQPEIDPNGSPSPSNAYSSEEIAKITEEQLNAAAAKQQEESASPVDNQTENESSIAHQQIDTASSAETQTDVQTQPQVVSDSPQEAASTMPSPGKLERDT